VKDITTEKSSHATNRRSFVKKGLLAGAATAGAGLIIGSRKASAAGLTLPPTPGDIAILRFLAAAELIESDLWVQYAQFGGLTPGQVPVETAPFTPMNGYQAAMMNLDSDGPQYISSNAGDEVSHATFLNAYLQSIGAPQVNFDKFRTLRSNPLSSTPTLTNLTQLSVDTTWYTRYHSTTNPDLGATFQPAIPQLTDGVFAALATTGAQLNPTTAQQVIDTQAIANTAAFHFGSIEQGGTSLYATLSQQVSNAEVLKITLSIGGDEICHFLEWVDFSGNGVQPPVAPITASTGLTFPNFDVPGQPSLEPGGPSSLLQTNLIFPVPCEFISPNLPKCAIIRPTSSAQGGAVAAIKGFVASGLFIGQPQSFVNLLLEMAEAADAAQRIIL
jgi:hypothetical protein